MGSLVLLLWNLVDVTSESRKVNRVPYCVRPVVFCLQVVAKVSTIDVKAEVCVEVLIVVPSAIDGNGDSCCWDMGSGLKWLGSLPFVCGSGKIVRVNI